MKEMLRSLIHQALVASIQHGAVSLNDFENAKIEVSRYQGLPFRRLRHQCRPGSGRPFRT